MVRAQNGVGAPDRRDGRDDIDRVTLAGIVIQKPERRGVQLSRQRFDLRSQKVLVLRIAEQLLVARQRADHQHAIEQVLGLEILVAPVLADPAGVVRVSHERRRRRDRIAGVVLRRRWREPRILLERLLQAFGRPEIEDRAEQRPLRAGDVAGGESAGYSRRHPAAGPFGVPGRQRTVPAPDATRHGRAVQPGVVEAAHHRPCRENEDVNGQGEDDQRVGVDTDPEAFPHAKLHFHQTAGKTIGVLTACQRESPSCAPTSTDHKSEASGNLESGRIAAHL